MADGANGSGSPLQKRQRTSRKCKKQNVHDISREESEDEDGLEDGTSNSGFSMLQMQQFASIFSTAIESAFALYQNASVVPPTSKQHGGAHEDERESGEEDDDDTKKGEEDDKITAYDKIINNLLGNKETVGPEISEKVARLLEMCLGPALDEKVAKEKRDLFPRPANIENLRVPRLNSVIYKKVTKEHQWSDRMMQQIQSFLVAGMAAVASQAEQAMKLRAWYNGLSEEEKDNLPAELKNLGKSYVTLMDATLLFTKTMNELTTLRRKIIKNDLVEPYKSLLDEEKNPATALWLAGNDVHAAIRKVKDNAFLAEKITTKTSWASNDKRQRSQPYERRSFGRGGGQSDQHRDRSHSRGSKDGFRGNSRGRGSGQHNRSRSEYSDRRDFYRRDPC